MNYITLMLKIVMGANGHAADSRRQSAPEIVTTEIQVSVASAGGLLVLSTNPRDKFST